MYRSTGEKVGQLMFGRKSIRQTSEFKDLKKEAISQDADREQKAPDDSLGLNVPEEINYEKDFFVSRQEAEKK